MKGVTSYKTNALIKTRPRPDQAFTFTGAIPTPPIRDCGGFSEPGNYDQIVYTHVLSTFMLNFYLFIGSSHPIFV